MQTYATHSKSSRKSSLLPDRQKVTKPGARLAAATPTSSNISQTIQRQASTETGNQTGLPDRLKAGVENLSGLSMNDVRVHYNSSKPSMLNAWAYTQGTDIHVGTGQERHLPHEVWHVAQQKMGVVSPTRQFKGLALNDDPALEREADLVGEKLSKRESISENLDRDQHISTPYHQSQAIQRAQSVVQANGPDPGRGRSYSSPARLEPQVRPEFLYFYCDLNNYQAILNARAIWRSGGAPAPGPAVGVGVFPAGAYATSVGPDAIQASLNDFRQQFYGGYPAVLTHYVKFRCTQNWQPEGRNIMHIGGGPVVDNDNPAQFAWHWVNNNLDTVMDRYRGVNILRDVPAASINIVNYGRL